MTQCKKTLESYDPFSAPCVLSEGHTGGHVTAGGARDTEAPEQCPAVLHYNGFDEEEFPCVRPKDHSGGHVDHEGYTWYIAYTDARSLSVPVYAAEPGGEQGDCLHGRPHDDLIKELFQRVSKIEPLVQLSGRSETGVVLLDPEQYSALLKDREELHALRNAAQTETVLPQCEWISPTKVRCNLPKGHTVNHITPYPPDHVCGPAC